MENLQIDGVTAIAVIVIASFGIDQIVKALLFGLSFVKPWNRVVPDPAVQHGPAARTNAEKRQKLAYFVLAGILGVVVIAFVGQVRIFEAVGFGAVNDALDSLITGLILVAGADRIGDLIGLMPGGSLSSSQRASREPQPIEITGRLVLEDDIRSEGTERSD